MLILPTTASAELMLNPESPSVWDASSESFLPHAHSLPVRVRAECLRGHHTWIPHRKWHRVEQKGLTNRESFTVLSGLDLCHSIHFILIYILLIFKSKLGNLQMKIFTCLFLCYEVKKHGHKLWCKLVYPMISIQIPPFFHLELTVFGLFSGTRGKKHPSFLPATHFTLLKRSLGQFASAEDWNKWRGCERWVCLRCTVWNVHWLNGKMMVRRHKKKYYISLRDITDTERWWQM